MPSSAHSERCYVGRMSPSGGRTLSSGVFSSESSTFDSYSVRLHTFSTCSTPCLGDAPPASPFSCERLLAYGHSREPSLPTIACTRPLHRCAAILQFTWVIMFILLSACARLGLPFPHVHAFSSLAYLERSTPADAPDLRPIKYLSPSSVLGPGTKGQASDTGGGEGASRPLGHGRATPAYSRGLETPPQSSRASRSRGSSVVSPIDPLRLSSYEGKAGATGDRGLSGFLRWVGGDEDGWTWASGQDNVDSSYSDEGVSPREAAALKLLREKKAREADKTKKNGSTFFGVPTQLLSLLDVESGQFTAEELLGMAAQEERQSGPHVRTPEERSQPLLGQPLNSRSRFYGGSHKDMKPAAPSLFPGSSNQTPKSRLGNYGVSGPLSYSGATRKGEEVPEFAPMSFINWQLLGATMSNPALQVTGSPLAASPIVFRQPDASLALSHHGKLVAVMAAVMVIGLVVLLLCCFMVQRKRAHEAYMRRPLTVPSGARRS